MFQNLILNNLSNDHNGTSILTYRFFQQIKPYIDFILIQYDILFLLINVSRIFHSLLFNGFAKWCEHRHMLLIIELMLFSFRRFTIQQYYLHIQVNIKSFQPLNNTRTPAHLIRFSKIKLIRLCFCSTYLFTKIHYAKQTSKYINLVSLIFAPYGRTFVHCFRLLHRNKSGCIRGCLKMVL